MFSYAYNAAIGLNRMPRDAISMSQQGDEGNGNPEGRDHDNTSQPERQLIKWRRGVRRGVMRLEVNSREQRRIIREVFLHRTDPATRARQPGARL